MPLNGKDSYRPFSRTLNAVDGLVLGNGAVYNFKEHIGGAHLTGGIKSYTIRNGYYLNNISYNYEGGLVGRYGYGSYFTDPSIREKIELSDGVLIDGETPSILFQDRVGDFYGIYGVERNTERKYVSTSDFTYLGYILRDKAVFPNLYEEEVKARYIEGGNDAKFSPDEKSSMDKDELGSEYTTQKKTNYYAALFGDRKELKIESEPYRIINMAHSSIYEPTNDAYLENFNKVDVNVNDEPDFSVKDKDKTRHAEVFNTDFGKDILEIGEKVRAKYSHYAITNEVVSKSDKSSVSKPLYDPYDSWVGDAEDEYGDRFDLNEPFIGLGSRIEIGEGGLFEYYTDEYSRYDALKLDKHGFSISQPYVINQRGTFRTNGVNSPDMPKTADYNYYQEMDMGAPVTEGHADAASDGFAPHIDSFSSASNIMKRTNDLFRNGTIKSLINRFHTDVTEAQADDFLISSYSDAGLSRGRNLLRGDRDRNTGFDNPYCRVWTAHHQYATLKDRIRPFIQGGTFMSIKELQDNLGRLRPNNGAQRLNDYSVLQDNGYVKITPFHRDGQLDGGRESLKKYMFSIENLAWKGFTTKEMLANEQIGPFGGRIMWFPPYNLKFNENINTSWRDNEFIGRGEKIYTYANTERGGTLDFTLLIDHPSIIDKASGMGKNALEEDDVLRFFAGCGKLEVGDVEDEPAPADNPKKDDDNNDDKTPKLKPDAEHIEVGYIIFYPNNFSAKKYWDNLGTIVTRIDEYEMNNGDEAFTEMDKMWENQKLADYNYDNFSKYNLNRNLWDAATAQQIGGLLGIDHMENYYPYSKFKKLNELYNSGATDGETGLFGYSTKFYEVDSIEVRGFASSHGYESANRTLSQDRAKTIQKLAQYFCTNIDYNKFTTGECLTISVDEPGKAEDVNDKVAKIARSAVITFKLKLRDDATPPIDGNTDEEGREGRYAGEVATQSADNGSEDGVTITETPNGVQEVVTTAFHSDGDKAYYTYQNEFMYFKQLEATNNLVYKNIVDKVKFFDPAFHSMTPEGFNARLNFLQQCTRQGPTVGSHAGNETHDESKYIKMAGNLAFGMAPYCILRIGDFYYSKIVIDAISINYDNGGGVQWDLNPEGVGVQPMMATVNISFKFIGGQDIDGPVAQLQNAISYNYYANSSIYTPSSQQSIPTYVLEED